MVLGVGARTLRNNAVNATNAKGTQQQPSHELVQMGLLQHNSLSLISINYEKELVGIYTFPYLLIPYISCSTVWTRYTQVTQDLIIYEPSTDDRHYDVHF